MRRWAGIARREVRATRRPVGRQHKRPGGTSGHDARPRRRVRVRVAGAVRVFAPAPAHVFVPLKPRSRGAHRGRTRLGCCCTRGGAGRGRNTPCERTRLRRGLCAPARMRRDSRRLVSRLAHAAALERGRVGGRSHRWQQPLVRGGLCAHERLLVQLQLVRVARRSMRRKSRRGRAHGKRCAVGRRRRVVQRWLRGLRCCERGEL